MQFRMRFFLIFVSWSFFHEFKRFHAKNKITVSIKKSKGDPEITKKSFFCFIYYLKYIRLSFA